MDSSTTTLNFASGGGTCAAVHVRAHGVAAGDARPCVVLAHGFAGTVDSGLMPFAERFAQAGCDALAFDYRGFGASPGGERQFLWPARQLEDWTAAVATARALPAVDPERIVLWGSSYSGGHVVAVGAGDPRIAAVIAQAPSMDGLPVIGHIARYAGIGTILRLTALGVRDAIASITGGEPVTVPAVGQPGELAAMSAAGAKDGYLAITGPTFRNEVRARVFTVAALYRPGRKADRLRCPLLVQVATRDQITPASQARAAATRGGARAELREYDITHFEIYTGAPFERSVGDQLEFLGRHVAGVRPADAPVAATAT